MTPPARLKTSNKVELALTPERLSSNWIPAEMRRLSGERPKRAFKEATESLDETWETRVFPLTVLTKICISVEISREHRGKYLKRERKLEIYNRENEYRMDG